TAACPGNDAGQAVMNINTNQAVAGHVAVVLALPATKTFEPGSKDLLHISFAAAQTNSATAFVDFADQPVRREVSATDATLLSADFLDGKVIVHPVPSLMIERPTDKIQVSWPLWATNFVLQETSGELGVSNRWSAVSFAPSVTSNENLVILPVEK